MFLSSPVEEKICSVPFPHYCPPEWLRFWPLQLRAGAFIQIETFYEIFHDVFTKLECSYVYRHGSAVAAADGHEPNDLGRSACSSNVKRTSSINAAVNIISTSTYREGVLLRPTISSFYIF